MPRSLPSPLRRLAALIPEGRPLPTQIWERRHHAMLLLLIVQSAALLGLTTVSDGTLDQHLPLAGVLLISVLLGAIERLSRGARTAGVAMGLLTCSALLVHLTGGAPESHFHFFVMVAVITLYQQWLPFAVAIVYVAVHHGLVGVKVPDIIPGGGSAVHGIYLLAAAAAGMLAWRLNEQQRATTDRILASTAEGIYGIDNEGNLTFVNEAMAKLIGREVDDLLGASAHVVCGHSAEDGVPYPAGACRLCEELATGDGVARANQCFRNSLGKVVPVEFTSVAVRERGTVVGTVVSVRDLTTHAELTERAMRDGLTGLPNRALFHDHLQQALARLGRSDQSIAVMFLDLDRFKVVNDSLGHAAGDTLLCAAAERLRASVRTHDTVARFGGDEFVVLCEGLDSERDVVTVAERIVSAFSRPFTVDGTEVSARASVGIAVTEDGSTAPDSLIRDADAAMYRAKEAGRGRYDLFDDELRARAMRRLQIESDLWRAIAHDELRVHYQPKVDLRSGAVTGVEALVRWEHPERGLVSPGEFIPIAEETGLIAPIGAWVLEEACTQAQRWRETSPLHRHLMLSVNVSGRQLTQPGLADMVAQVLERTGTPANLLCLEITESVLMTDAQSTIAALTELKALGLRIAVDDFGTGYSSLSYLSRFPVDILKVDRQFISELGPNAESWPIVAAVIGMSKALGLSTIAEGVEEEHQATALRNLGCEIAQGFRFARPQPPAELDRLLLAGLPWVTDAAGTPVPAIDAAMAEPVVVTTG